MSSPLTTLPNNMIGEIFNYLSAEEIVSSRGVDKHLHSVATNTFIDVLSKDENNSAISLDSKFKTEILKSKAVLSLLQVVTPSINDLFSIQSRMNDQIAEAQKLTDQVQKRNDMISELAKSIR